MNHFRFETLAVGDIIYGDIGYDCTKYSFFQVIAKGKATIKVAQVDKDIIGNGAGPCYNVKPVKFQFIGKPMTKKLRSYKDYDTMKINDYHSAFYLYNGEILEETVR